MKILESPVAWHPIPRYQLKNLKNDFQIADFERTVNTAHVRHLKDAIMKNQFYNNMISVTNTDKPWTVFDGQHRLSALWLCHIENKLQTYNLMLAIYPKEFGRLIYRRINMGIALKLKDHLKAIDDKKTPFFTELQPWLSHDPRPDKPLYVSMLQAISYSRGSPRSVNINTLDEIMSTIKQKEIDVAKRVCQVTKLHTQQVFGQRLYHSPIQRNVYKAALHYNLTEKQIQDLIDAMLKDERITEITRTRHRSDIVRAYEYIRENIIPGILKK